MKTKTNALKKTKHNKTKKKADYYYTVNKHWIQNHRHIPPSRNETNQFVLLQNKVNRQLKHILEDDSIKKSNRIKILYQSFLTTPEKQIEKEIHNSITVLHYLRENGSLYDFIAWFFSSDFSPLFHWYIGVDEKNPSQYISYFQESDLSLRSKQLYLSNSHLNTTIREKYNGFISRLFSTIFGKNHTYKLSNILEIEKEISQYYYDEKDSNNFDKLYNLYTKEKIYSDFDFDWNQFLISLNLKKEEIDSFHLKTVILNPRYFKHIMNLLIKNWNSDNFLSYWVYRILLTYAPFHKKLREIKFHFYYPRIKVPSERTISLMKVEEIMNSEINRLYIEKYKHTKEIAFVEKVIPTLQHILKKRIRENNWLSPTTKEKIVSKISKMHFTIGYKKEWESDPDCEFLPNNSFQNYEYYVSWKIQNQLKKLKHPHVPSLNTWYKDYNKNTFDVNAFYANNRNELIIPNAILQPPFINLEKSIAYNYSNIVTVIGHEMMHSLDNDGIEYDTNGSRHSLLKEEETKHYQHFQKELETYYEKQEKPDEKKSISIGENIADIGGFLLAEEAFIDFLKGEKNITHELKQFYKFYAEKWRSIEKPHNKLEPNDNHSNTKYRVNCVLNMSTKFLELYPEQESKESAPVFPF